MGEHSVKSSAAHQISAEGILLHTLTHTPVWTVNFVQAKGLRPNAEKNMHETLTILLRRYGADAPDTERQARASAAWDDTSACRASR